MSLAAGALLEPLAAPLLGWLESLEEELLEELGEDELGAEELVEPPAAESFFVASADEEELDEDGGVLGVVVTEPDAEVELEPDGVLALPDGVVEPEDDEDVAPGARARSPALSPQAVSKLAPKIIDTATAKVESLICGPPWLG